MRVMMVKAEKVWGSFYAAKFTRFADEEKVQAFIDTAIPVWEQMATDS